MQSEKYKSAKYKSKKRILENINRKIQSGNTSRTNTDQKIQIGQIQIGKYMSEEYQSEILQNKTGNATPKNTKREIHTGNYNPGNPRRKNNNQQVQTGTTNRQVPVGTYKSGKCQSEKYNSENTILKNTNQVIHFGKD